MMAGLDRCLKLLDKACTYRPVIKGGVGRKKKSGDKNFCTPDYSRQGKFCCVLPGYVWKRFKPLRLAFR